MICLPLKKQIYMEVGYMPSRLFEDFLSNKWNLYGLQIISGCMMLIVLHQYLSIFQICIMGLCTFLISFCQRLLGIQFGILYYELNQDEIGGLLKEIRRLNETEKEEDGDNNK